MRRKDWSQFTVQLDKNASSAVMTALGDRIPEDWTVDMKWALVASSDEPVRMTEKEYGRFYRRLGRTEELTVLGIGMNDTCACALCSIGESRRRVLLPLAHDWGSRTVDALSVRDFEPVDPPVKVSGVMTIRRPGGESEDEVRGKYLRRAAEWKKCLSSPMNIVSDGNVLVDGKVRDILDRMPSRLGWYDRADGLVNVYVPNCMVHSDIQKQMNLLDSKILSQTVGRAGIGVLLKDRTDDFLKLMEPFTPSGGPDDTLYDRVFRHVHSVSRSLASMVRESPDGEVAPESPAMQGWARIRECLKTVNPDLPLYKNPDGSVSRTDKLFAEAVASYAGKVRYNDPELLNVSRDEIRGEFNRAIGRLADRHDELEAAGGEMSREELERTIRLGHPSNVLLCATSCLRDTDTVITGKAIYGKTDKQDKQLRHPYDVREALRDLPDQLDDPLAAYYHRDDSNSVTVIVDRGVDDPDGHCTFVCPLCYSEEMRANIVKTYFPKWDIDIILNLARSQENGRPLVSYVRHDFMERWFRPACERIRRYYEETLPAVYEGEEKDGVWEKEMKKYEAFKANLPFAEKKISYMTQFDVPDDGKRFFRVQTASAEPSGDLVGRLDAPIAIAASEEQRNALREYKRSVVEKYVKGIATTPFSVCTLEDVETLMLRDGVSADDTASVVAALEEGLEINGFMHGGKTYIISDNMHSLEQVRLTYIHERQHALDATVEKGRMDALVREIDADRAWHLLSCLSRERDAYDGRTTRELLSEACAYAMELAYGCEPSEVGDMLRSKGIKDDTFINFIKDKNNEQYKDNGLSQSRHSSSFCDGYRIRGGRIQQETLGTRMAGQGARPDDKHRDGPEGIGEESPIALLSALQKHGDGIRYPLAAELEGVAPSAPFLTAPRTSPALSFRIQKNTKPVITKWFDLWFKASYGKSFQPVNNEVLPEIVPDIVEDAEGGDVEELNNAERKRAWTQTRDAYREQFLGYISTLEGNALQLAAAKWFCTGSVRLPEDIDKVEKALHVASVNKIDPHTFSSPMELILRYAREKSVKYVSPYGFPEISGETVLENGLHFFSVQDDEQGQLAVRMVLNGQSNNIFHDGNASPWCLLTATEGKRLPTDSAKKYWNHYNGFPKGIWMKEVVDGEGKPALDADGRPRLEAIAFHADAPNNKERQTNWSIEDRPYYDGKVPVIRRDDERNRTEDVYCATTGRLLSSERLLSSSDVRVQEITKEHFGDRAEEFLRKSDLVKVSLAYDQKSRIRAVKLEGTGAISSGMAVSYRYDGDRRTLWTEQNLVNGYKVGPYRSFWPNGNPKLVCTYSENRSMDRIYKGDYVQYFEDGSIHKKGRFTPKGFPVGEHVENYPDGTPKKVFVYDDNAELKEAVTYTPEGLMASRTVGDVLTTYYPVRNPATGEQPVDTVCPEYKFIKINRNYKGLVAKKEKTQYHPRLREDGSPAVKRITRYRDFSRYLRETRDFDGKVTALEWSCENSDTRFLRTDDRMKQVVVQLPLHQANLSVSMRVVYNDDWTPAEVTVRKHDKGMRADGPNVVFHSGGKATLIRYHDGVAAETKTLSAKEAVKMCSGMDIFRLCETVRTGDMEKISELYLRILDGKTDGQTPLDVLVANIRDDYNGKYSSPVSDDLPYRIEGREGVTEREPATFDGMRRWFVGLDDGRQRDIFRAAGLDSPERYGMNSFAEMFCHAMTESPAVVLSPDQLAVVYNTYDEDRRLMPETLDRELLPDPARVVNMKQEQGEKDEYRISIGDARMLGAQMIDAVRRCCGSSLPATLLYACRLDGSLLETDNALAAAAVSSGKGWAPDFVSVGEMKELGVTVSGSAVKPLLVKSAPDADGRVRTEMLYNISDTTFPKQHPEEYEMYGKVRKGMTGELREWLDTALPDREDFRNTVYASVVAANGSFAEYPEYLCNLIEMDLNLYSGKAEPLPYNVHRWPDDLTSYNMTRAVGRAVGKVVGEYMPKEGPSFRTIIGKIREVAREKSMAWAKDYGNGTGTGKGIH